MRYIIPIAVVLGLVGVLIAIKASQIGMLIRFGEEAQAAGPPPEVVGTQVAKSVNDWTESLEATGTVRAGKGVTVSNEAPGMVKAIRFESGQDVKAGDVLVELDTAIERAQLASAIAQRDYAILHRDRVQKLVAAKAVAESELDAAESTVKTTQSQVSSLQAQIALKTVRAPFNGKLGIREVNLGQYLGPGTPITTLQSSAEQFVDFSVPQQRLADVKVGAKIEATLSAESTTSLTGTVVAIEPSVDVATRTATLRASINDPENLLRPGMWVTAKLTTDGRKSYVLVPVTAVVFEPYGSSLFVVEQGKDPAGKPIKVARQHFVRVAEQRGDFAALEAGLKGGEEVVSVGAFKLRNGSPIVINNEAAKRAPELSPSPENR